jgi:hypothetical protein
VCAIADNTGTSVLTKTSAMGVLDFFYAEDGERGIIRESYRASIPQRELGRVHWSKEASSFGFACPYWPIGIRLICYWIIDAMVEAIIR